ncbi:MAG TPA: phosphoglycerate dehydrogenase [Thermoanaerobaculia bacterium]|nr:phosphoglycerate dehydrogenase [Thermoanaerobaculia bacterium]
MTESPRAGLPPGRVLVADPLAPSAVELLRSAGVEVVEATNAGRERLAELLAPCEALLVRSRTRVDAELLAAGPRLRVVGRAGTGTDNIDLAAASRRGILVINAPGANTVSAVEHTFALLLALARQVPAADASLRAGEWKRSRFLGTELRGKTLGILGLGRIGREVAERARAFRMVVVAHDPHLIAGTAARVGVELLALDELLARADVVTLHLPLTPQTHHLLDADRLAGMKRGALLINCARGGLIDEAALLAALDAGHLGGAGLDVFATEPPADLALAAHPRVVATPHLGAQTREAQERASSEVAAMVLRALAGALDVPAVNLPFAWSGGVQERYLLLAERLGRLAAGLVEGPVREIRVSLLGIDDGLAQPLAVAATRGALADALGPAVSYVNAEAVAGERGIEVVRSVRSRAADLPPLVEIEARGAETVTVAGALFGDRQLRVLRFGNLPLEMRPEGELLVLRTWDRPGVIGEVGEILGGAGVNIADLHLARRDGDEDALMVLRLDEPPDAELLARLRALPAVRLARCIDLGPRPAEPAGSAAVAPPQGATA